MDVYEKSQKLATKFLGKYRQGVIEYIRNVDATPNGPNPTVTPAAPVTLNAVARGVSRKYVDGTKIVMTDLMITTSVDAFTVPPELTGKIVVDGVKHNILQIETVPPAGTPVVYKIIFRKG